jgi:hypothetical protein
MTGWGRYVLVGLILLLIGVLPVVYHRAVYAHQKRLRVVDPGRVYRCGQLTAAGFRDAIDRFGIRTVVNLQDEFPDPDLNRSYFDRSTVRESELCDELGVRYVFISPDLLRPRQVPARRPAAIEEMLAVFDDPDNYPILIHCRAGLHRTGCMAAVYRREYQGWTASQAVAEMRAHGFGDSVCTSANEYVRQYVTTYRPGLRVLPAGAQLGGEKRTDRP